MGVRFDDSNKGSVYVYGLSNGNWIQTQKLITSDSSQSFGLSITIHKNNIIVGAEDSADTDIGLVYLHKISLFERSDSVEYWIEQGVGLDELLSNTGGFTATQIINANYDVQYWIDQGEDISDILISLSSKLTASDGSSDDFFGN